MSHAERIPLSNKERYYILARDQFTCQYCGRPAPEVELHVDHLIPVARGGTNEQINLLAACTDCNLSKQAMLLPTDVIKQKQTEIIKRTNLYEQFLKEQPVRKEKEVDNSLKKRPLKLLRQFNHIAEPLRNRTLNPTKRHALKVIIKEIEEIDLVYARLDTGGWVQEPIDGEEGTLRPMTAKQFEALEDLVDFKLMDDITESELRARILSDQESGVQVILLTDISGSVAFSFFSPIEDLEIAVEFPELDDHTPSDDELAFYS